MRFDAFTQGFYSFPSLNAASQLCVNYYPDLVEGAMPKGSNPGGTEKARMVLTPTPGTTLYGTAPLSPCRGLWAGDNRLFAAEGSRLYEVLGPASFTDHGSIGNDSNPVQMIPNGNQLFVVSAGNAYVDTGSGVQQCQFSQQLYDLVIDLATGRLTGDTGGIFDSTDVGKTVEITGGTGFTIQNNVITAVDSNGMATGTTSWGTAGSTEGTGIEWLGEYVEAIQGAFLDGTFFAVQPTSKTVYYSAINDGTSWDPLNFFSKEAYPDDVAAIIADHEQLYLQGNLESTEVWADTGSGTNPFQRNPSYIMHYGTGAPWSLVRLSTGVAWIGGDVRRGERVAFLAVGYVPARVSTAAIEKAWAAYATIEDAVAYGLIQDGHEFWVISFPTGNATWVYDVTLGEWHQRGLWAGVSTTIAANVATGSQVVTPASMTGISLGVALTISNANGSNSQTVVPTAVGGSTFTATFTLPLTGPGITVFAAVWNRQSGAFHACTGIGTIDEVHYVGDWQSGNIYVMQSTALTDHGTPIHRRRRAPHLSNANKKRFYGLFELDCDATGADVDNTPPRVRWLRCGASRDRIYQTDDDGNGNLTLSYSDDRCLSFTKRSSIGAASSAAAIGITAAYVEWTEGTG
jgi:hypothetical protein